MAGALEDLAGEPFCYVRTTGRVTGRPHEIEIWFGLRGQTIYMLAGGRERSDWVRNIVARPEVKVRIGEREFAGAGRVLEAGTEEDALARRLLLDKYSSTYSGDLTDWGRTALPVAVELDAAPG
jgi:deazaflavin-dependent oxidoreductase (nitroreductase family)